MSLSRRAAVVSLITLALAAGLGCSTSSNSSSSSSTTTTAATEPSTGGTAATPGTGGAGGGELAFDSIDAPAGVPHLIDGALWLVANGSAVELDDDLAQVRSMTSPTPPVLATADGSLWGYVATNEAAWLVKVDPSTGAEISRLTLGAPMLSSAVIGDAVYYADRPVYTGGRRPATATLHRVDVVTGSDTTIANDVAGVVADGGRLFGIQSADAGAVVEVDLASGAVTPLAVEASSVSGDRSVKLAVGDGVLVVVYRSGALATVELASKDGAATESPCPKAAEGEAPNQPNAGVAAGRVWTVCSDGSVTSFDPATLEIDATGEIDTGPSNVAGANLAPVIVTVGDELVIVNGTSTGSELFVLVDG